MESTEFEEKMEGNRRTSQHDLLMKIREFSGSIIKGIADGRSPLLVSIDRFKNYCTDSSGSCCCSSDTAKGREIITLQRECHVRRLDVLLRVLLIVQKLLQENKHGSKRDIYYMHPSVFREQSVVDRAINDICILLQCSRHNLNVVSVGKGLVMGWLRFSEAGRKFDCINSLNSAHPVPVNVEEVKDIMSLAKYILIVEKESVFQRLANDHFCKRNHCIVITGRGYPDIPTRRFLRLLIENLRLPTFCLVDCDPYGFDILTTYRFGSMQLAYDAKFLRITEIYWIGAFLTDVDKFSLPKQCLLPLTKEDKSRTESLLQRCYIQREVPEWRSELELLLQRGVKFEIEALSVHSLSFLSEVYIPSKIQVKQKMEYCMEARALKTSFLSEVAMKTTTQQVFFDDVWCVTGINNVSADDFSVDDLLDFSDKEFKETFIQNSQKEEEEEDAEKDSLSVDEDNNSSNSVNSQISGDFDSLAAGELSLPVDEMENLEWLSQIVDDSVSGLSLLCPAGKYSGGRSEPDRKRFTVLDLPEPVHKKTRTKRCRPSGKVWSFGLLLITESFSPSFSQDSTGSYPVHVTDSYGSGQKPPAKKPRKNTNGESSSSGSLTLRRCSHCLVQKTPQWRTGPLGPKTLCNACGVRFKSGRLFPEYRPACSPTFSGEVHSNSHRKVLEMRRKKETVENVQTRFTPMVQSF